MKECCKQDKEDVVSKRASYFQYGVIAILVVAAGIGVWAVTAKTTPPLSTQMLSGVEPLQAAAGSGEKITVYKSPGCGCCGGYVQYLRDNGFDVEVVETQDIDSIKHKHSIPQDVWSCHTAVMGDYFIEGHMPIEAIKKLVAEKPQIDGIALPGMPAGSPGMGGTKRHTFAVVSLKDGAESAFAEV